MTSVATTMILVVLQQVILQYHQMTSLSLVTLSYSVQKQDVLSTSSSTFIVFWILIRLILYDYVRAYLGSNIATIYLCSGCVRLYNYNTKSNIHSTIHEKQRKYHFHHPKP